MAAARRMEAGAGDGGGSRLVNRPQIEIQSGEFTRTATLAERAMIAAELPVYDRGGILVYPVEMDMKDEHDNTIKSVALQPITVPLMRQFMETAAEFVKYNPTLRTAVTVDPPEKTARLILARRGFWPFPRIVGVMTAQSIDREGNIIDTEGVHEPTRLLFHGLPHLPPMPPHPTRDDALAALETLKELLVEFPFVDPEGRKGVSLSVALAALISPLCRGANPHDPLFIVHAPVAGTGKSYLCKLVAAILTGRACPVVAYAVDEHEFEKRLNAVMLLGSPIISLDNINGTFKSLLLCQALTEDTVQLRPLGTSTVVVSESRTFFMANGNNIGVAEDMTRRTLLAKLDLNEERPELRQFQQRPFDKIIADRGRYIAACLTIVRAYILAGRPGKLPQLASYEAWSDNVRSALVWLGCADPCDSMNEIIENDAPRQLLRALQAAWPEARNIGCTCAGLIEASRGNEELKEILEGIAGVKDGISAKKLGYWLRDNANGKVHVHQIEVDGVAVPVKLKILKGKVSGGIQRWILTDGQDG
ncbi:hypothetical protein [Sinorhizobium meliloti]|uniref:hypothetical protein n=1 Tax=Rhizobium meliloti TaxID=382 RepID=UPI001297BB21|nr:hypothetical protein [Sinorhizobium meliloti]MQU85749.1 hypothetical protein [Sinorhizobium meliloti]MQU89285.1 hypothetical protein [Sinorhizobium meliloti]